VSGWILWRRQQTVIPFRPEGTFLKQEEAAFGVVCLCCQADFGIVSMFSTCPAGVTYQRSVIALRKLAMV